MNGETNKNKCLPVSVIIPIYNAENYLNECIESLLHQSYEHLEIILVDDGSTDSSGKICDNYSSLSSAIKVIHTSNQGRTKARIIGVEQAIGDYVSFVDADDYVAPTYIEYLVSCISEYQVELSCCQYYRVQGNVHSFLRRSEYGYFDKNEIERILSNNFLFDDQLRMSSIPPFLWGKLFKKDSILHALPVGSEMWFGEDIVTLFYIMQHTNSLFVSEEAYYYYRLHQGQTIRLMNKERWNAEIRLYQTLADLDNKNILSTQIPSRVFSHLKEWLRVRYLTSNSFGEFKSDMAYALNNETMEKYFMHKHITTSNKRHRILAFLAQHKMYFLYYMFLKVHLATLRFRG